VSPVRCELGFYILQDEILHSHRRGNHKSYIFSRDYVRFEVFTAVTTKNTVFCDAAPCGSCKNRRMKNHTASHTRRHHSSAGSTNTVHAHLIALPGSGPGLAERCVIGVVQERHKSSALVHKQLLGGAALCQQGSVLTVRGHVPLLLRSLHR
jgi:hypothetical protein